MPKLHGQPRPVAPKGSHTGGQPKAMGKGSPTSHNAHLKTTKDHCKGCEGY